MSDCSPNAWEIPGVEKREPGVLYQHQLYTNEYYQGLLAIQVGGVRFYREDFDVVYDVENGRVTGVTVDGQHFTKD